MGKNKVCKTRYAANRFGGKIIIRLSDRDGFTLLELLVSMTILAIMVVVLSLGFNISIKVWEAGGEKINEFYGVTELMSLVSSQLKTSKKVYTINRELMTRHVAFSGTESSVSFVTLVPILTDMDSPVALFVQTVEFDSSSKSLIFKEGFFDPLRPVTFITGKEIASEAGKIKSFKIQYYVKNLRYAPRINNEPEYLWRPYANYRNNKDEIQDQSILPKAVRINIELTGKKGGFIWPTITIPLHNDNRIAQEEPLR